MELTLEGESNLASTDLENLITRQMDNIYDMQPLICDLKHYDELIGEQGRESSSQSGV